MRKTPTSSIHTAAVSQSPRSWEAQVDHLAGVGATLCANDALAEGGHGSGAAEQHVSHDPTACDGGPMSLERKTRIVPKHMRFWFEIRHSACAAHDHSMNDELSIDVVVHGAAAVAPAAGRH